MFPAQVIKDASMAYKVNTIMAENKRRGATVGWGDDSNSGSSGGGGGGVGGSSGWGGDKVMVICGNGHMGFGHGVPERIFAAHPEVGWLVGWYQQWYL